MKDPRILLQYILECADRVEDYLEDVQWKDFLDDSLIQDAVFRRLEVIGQAVKDLPAGVRNQHAGVPWREIAGMRDKLSHDYLGIDLEITWHAAKQDLPEFRKQVEGILEQMGEGDFS